MSYLQYKWVVILSQILIAYGMARQWCQTYQIIQNFKKLINHSAISDCYDLKQIIFLVLYNGYVSRNHFHGGLDVSQIFCASVMGGKNVNMYGFLQDFPLFNTLL